ncbi:LacI family DNA-binding transcriptional regulator [Agromyces archimandritae]|uniref:LacI family DNA-binding transcriptional regulator n=1 Tax=Agromyces archimandritae TaxID=2781962 RepID=A0A975FNZ8_9MICO|nr:LacI family DNA-binding transcriptional regulator [Agromyces archimandritae]QTX05177.1 LacI family DNA-binding transcriptional regulator [Agromyces archimandritae]
MTPTEAARSATRSDVARLAGVSTAVVSYVVNDGPRPVAAETRRRVLDAIRALGYRPNASARALKRGSTRLLGLVVSEIVNPFHSECIDALDLAASRHGYSLLLASTRNDDERDGLLRSTLIERGVEGMIFLSVFPDERRGAGEPEPDAHVPRLILDRAAPVQGFATVGADTAGGAERATEHLIAHGHRRIAFIEGPLRPIIGDDRRVGWERALRAAGLLEGPRVVAEWSRQGGARAARTLLASDDPPTAIFAGSDLMAIGALQALHEAGRRVPEDVAVVAFDGTAESEFSVPPLTAVRQPFAAMADATVEAFATPGAVPGHTTFDMQLVVRRSCGCRGGIDATAR